MFGIKINNSGSVGWIVGKDADIWLFKDKASAAAELKKFKTDDRYMTRCRVCLSAKNCSIPDTGGVEPSVPSI